MKITVSKLLRPVWRYANDGDTRATCYQWRAGEELFQTRSEARKYAAQHKTT